LHKDRIKWDRRYSDKAVGAPSPSSFLIDHRCELKPGTVLDLASGDGAAALYLAQDTTFTVTAADISEQGLKRLSSFAQLQGVAIQTVCVDFDDKDAMAKLGSFDNIVICLFKPSHELLKQLAGHLNPAGKLLLSTFNQRHHRNTGFPLSYCLSEKEFYRPPIGLSLLKYQANPELEIDSYLFVAQS